MQLYGTTNWPIITTSFERFSAKLCELRWNVLHLDALEKARKPVPASKEYTDWEVAVMLRVSNVAASEVSCMHIPCAT